MYQIQRTITYTCIEVNKSNFTMLENIGVIFSSRSKGLIDDTAYHLSQDKNLSFLISDIVEHNKTVYFVLDPITKKWSKYDEISFKSTSPEIGSFSKV